MSHFKLNHFRFIFLLLIFVQSVDLNAKPSKTENPNANNNQVETPEEPPSEFEQLLDKELSLDKKENQEKIKESPNWVYQIFKTIVGLAFIIIILYLFRKYMIFKNSFGDVQTGIIKLLHEYPVATGKKLQIIEVGNRLLLIGISDAGIQLVSEFKEKLPIDQIKLAVESYGKNETRDFWVELSKGITNKIQNVLSPRKSAHKFESTESKSWENLQENARMKIKEMRDKKRIFEDLDK